MKLDKTKLNFIAFCGFINLLAILSLVIFFVLYSMFVVKGFNNFNFIEFWNNNKLALLIILIALIVFDLVSTFCIWGIKWESDWCKSSKLVYGFLNIILPFLIPFIFVGIGKSKIREERELEMNELLKANLLPPHIAGYIEPYQQNNRLISNNHPNNLVPGNNFLENKSTIKPEAIDEVNHPYNYPIIDFNDDDDYVIKYQEKMWNN